MFRENWRQKLVFAKPASYPHPAGVGEGFEVLSVVTVV